MKNSSNKFSQKILEKISKSDPGSIFFISDFAELNNDIMVGRVLSMAEKIGKLIRISKGIYFKPSYSKFGLVYPSTEKIVEAIAKRDKTQIMPTGDTALNLLGLSTQVPMNPVFLTSGSSRVIKIGKRRIVFKHSVPRNFAFKGKIIPLIIQAMKSIGQENLTEQVIGSISDLLMEFPEKETALHDVRLAPLWIKKHLLPLLSTPK